MSSNALQKFRELEAQKKQYANEARQEALAEATAAVEVLNELGCSYSLVSEEVGKRPLKSRSSRKPRGNKDCPVCKFQTDPPHDGRHHKNQAEKAPFTAEELAAKGMKHVGQLGANGEPANIWPFVNVDSA